MGPLVEDTDAVEPFCGKSNLSVFPDRGDAKFRQLSKRRQAMISSKRNANIEESPASFDSRRCPSRLSR